MSAEDYIDKNKKAWDAKTPWHIDSAFYDQAAFLDGKSSLHEIELNLLGDVTGKRILHLQCHFGQDTISLSRMGAITTGVDFSEKAITKAREMATQMQVAANFVCCNLYDVPDFIEEQFDIVYTSYGTISWLPDLDRWARIISTCLKPGGQFIFVEFHPVVWMFSNDFTKVEYKYSKDAPIVETEKGTYADTNAPVETETISWNHSLSEVITALLHHDLKLEFFEEYHHSPYDVFANMEEIAPGKFQIKAFGDKLPLVYALRCLRM